MKKTSKVLTLVGSLALCAGFVGVGAYNLQADAETTTPEVYTHGGSVRKVDPTGLRFLSSLALFHPRLLPSLHSSSKETELRNVPSDPSDLFEVAVQRVLGLHAGHFLFGGAKRSFVSNFSWAKSDVTGVVFFFS